MSTPKELSVSEWAVLGLIAECETHGFALARAFAPEGFVGKIWTIPRPLVYRAITTLLDRELISETGWAPGSAAPKRRLVAATDTGRSAVTSWLSTPVAHVRDARSELLIKLLLHDRAGSDPTTLLVAQRDHILPMVEGLRAQLDGADGFDAAVVRWRLYSTEALLRFLEDLLTAPVARP